MLVSFIKLLLDLMITNLRYLVRRNEVQKLKGSNHRVLFQNAEGNINMGVFFDDPDVELDEIYWYNAMANAIFDSLRINEGLISTDKELKTHSCYVELHRKGSNS